MSGTYAKGTDVTPDKSRTEIERLLRKYGADGFTSGWDNNKRLSAILFRYHGKMVRFVVAIPSETDPEIRAQHRKGRSPIGHYVEREERRRWRALALAVKAKLELVASGITTFEDEFLSHIVAPNGQTIGEWIQPHLEQAYLSGCDLPLLPAGPS
jgi:hypothetical protein